jgi:hypothetical protein
MKIGWTELDDSFVQYISTVYYRKQVITVLHYHAALGDITDSSRNDTGWGMDCSEKPERNAPLKINGLRRCTFQRWQLEINRNTVLRNFSYYQSLLKTRPARFQIWILILLWRNLQNKMFFRFGFNLFVLF